MLEILRAELARFVRAVTARFEHAVLYPATVRAQADDGTLALELDAGAPVPSLVGVPIRHGLPGVTAVAVQAGARVRVGFDGADPSRPFAVLWDAGSDATSIVFSGSSRQLARTQDAVDCGHLVVAAGSVVGYLPPGTPVPSLPVGQSAIALSGTITGSSIIRG